jgi:hypothetical protein
MTKLGALPDGLWELDISDYLLLPIKRLDTIRAALTKTTNIRDLVENVFDDHLSSDPVNARCLFSLCLILADSI